MTFITIAIIAIAILTVAEFYVGIFRKELLIDGAIPFKVSNLLTVAGWCFIITALTCF